MSENFSKLLQETIGCAALFALVILLTQCGNKSMQNWSNADIRWYDTGMVTANGEKFEPTGLTYASKTHKFGTLLDIRWDSVSITARCNDRGPNEVELTKGAFSKLADPNIGVLHNAKIKIQK